jgi:hypothetical protein
MTIISEKKAKKDWYITNVNGLNPVEDYKDNHSNRKENKKKKYYHLSDVIGRAIKTTCSQQPQTTDTSHQSSKNNNQQQHIVVSQILRCPQRKRLYAHYLFNLFEDACQNVDDPSIIKEVYEFRKKRHQQERDDELLFQNKRKTSE